MACSIATCAIFSPPPVLIQPDREPSCVTPCANADASREESRPSSVGELRIGHAHGKDVAASRPDTSE